MMLAPAAASPAQIRKNRPSRSGVKTLIRVALLSMSFSATTLGTGSPMRASAVATWRALAAYHSIGSASQ